MIYFNMNLFSHDWLHYNALDNILNGKNTVIYEGEIDFLQSSPLNDDAVVVKDKKVIDAIGHQQEQVIQTGDDAPITEEQMGANLFNSRSFRDFVMLAYEYKCAITRQVISCNGFINL